MLKNYLRIAVRNLAKYKFISFINFFGLTVGLSCCLLILTYILHETSYDRYNSKADRIWRVTRSFNNNDGVVSLHLGAVAPPFGPLLQNDFPDIQQMTRLLRSGPKRRCAMRTRSSMKTTSFLPIPTSSTSSM